MFWGVVVGSVFDGLLGVSVDDADAIFFGEDDVSVDSRVGDSVLLSGDSVSVDSSSRVTPYSIAEDYASGVVSFDGLVSSLVNFPYDFSLVEGDEIDWLGGVFEGDLGSLFKAFEDGLFDELTFGVIQDGIDTVFERVGAGVPVDGSVQGDVVASVVDDVSDSVESSGSSVPVVDSGPVVEPVNSFPVDDFVVDERDRDAIVDSEVLSKFINFFEEKRARGVVERDSREEFFGAGREFVNDVLGANDVVKSESRVVRDSVYGVFADKPEVVVRDVDGSENVGSVDSLSDTGDSVDSLNDNGDTGDSVESSPVSDVRVVGGRNVGGAKPGIQKFVVNKVLSSGVSVESSPSFVGVNVDANGRPRSRDDVQPWEVEGWGYVRDNGKINMKELEFFSRFKGFGSGSRVSEGDVNVALRAPVNAVESPEQRRARVARINQSIGGDEFLKRGSKSRVTLKDLEVLQFLALFRYAKVNHVAQVLSVGESAALARLRRLRDRGLVLSKDVIGVKAIWFVSKVGMLLSGYDLPLITDSNLTFSMFPHQFAVNHVAANLWGAGVNVLDLSDFPVKNKVDVNGKPVFGELLTSEVEIQSSLGKLKSFYKSDTYLPTIKRMMDEEFREWTQAGGVDSGVSPEMLVGNEYMWALYPPYNVKLAYHVPDLVVKRDRASDGSPQSIAVEIERKRASVDSYARTLLAYKFDNRIFKNVIWVCQNKSSAGRIREAAERVGLSREECVIVPVLTRDGVFKSHDMWLL